jgi:hypothetical protein
MIESMREIVDPLKTGVIGTVIGEWESSFDDSA